MLLSFNESERGKTFRGYYLESDSGETTYHYIKDNLMVSFIKNGMSSYIEYENIPVSRRIKRAKENQDEEARKQSEAEFWYMTRERDQGDTNPTNLQIRKVSLHLQCYKLSRATYRLSNMDWGLFSYSRIGKKYIGVDTPVALLNGVQSTSVTCNNGTGLHLLFIYGYVTSYRDGQDPIIRRNS